MTNPFRARRHLEPAVLGADPPCLIRRSDTQIDTHRWRREAVKNLFIGATNISFLHLNRCVVDISPLRGCEREKKAQGKRENDDEYGERSEVVFHYAGARRHEAAREGGRMEVTGVAFIRKRGSSYYLVHNVRKKGRVRQVHLACLGRRPRISDELIRDIEADHPFFRVNWKDLRERASHELVQPMLNNAEYVRDLLSEIRSVHLEIADLHLPVLEMVHGRELRGQLTSELKLLRGTLDVKLNQFRKGKPLSLRS